MNRVLVWCVFFVFEYVEITYWNHIYIKHIFVWSESKCRKYGKLVQPFISLWWIDFFIISLLRVGSLQELLWRVRSFSRRVWVTQRTQLNMSRWLLYFVPACRAAIVHPLYSPASAHGLEPLEVYLFICSEIQIQMLICSSCMSP